MNYQRSKRYKRQENHDRWLVSYADYMTLMFAFFVVLYALAQIDKERFTLLSESLGEVLQLTGDKGKGLTGAGLLTNTRPDINNELYGQSLQDEYGTELVAGKAEIKPTSKPKIGKPLEDLHDELQRSLGELEDSGWIQIEEQEEWLLITMAGDLVFSQASASLNDSGRIILKSIAQSIQPIGNGIRIRGFTDNIPINNELFSSNWHLSVMRATAIVYYLEKSLIAPFRLAIEGYGEQRPVATNLTGEGRSKNRKVEIAISKYLIEPVKFLQEELIVDKAENTNKKNSSQETSYVDSNQVQVIELPGGGIRITTRIKQNLEQEHK